MILTAVRATAYFIHTAFPCDHCTEVISLPILRSMIHLVWRQITLV